MVSEKMFELGAKRSVIRELFEYGKQQAEVVGPENIYDFSIGNPTVPAPECVKEAIEDLLENAKSQEIHGYTSATGDHEVRKSLAAYMNQTYGCQLNADHFYMTCGAAASLCITFKALTVKPTDEIIMIAPYFPEYKVFIEHAGATPVMVAADTERFQINFQGLEKAIGSNTIAVVINTPNNPTGVAYTPETLKRLAALLKRKSEELGRPIYLISDEPYRELVYDNIPIQYIPSFYENTIVCYSFSKSLSLPGERIGYVLIPEGVFQGRDVYTAVCGAGRCLGYVCAPSLFQKVIQKCLGKTSDVALYDENRQVLYRELTRMGYECVKPDGAFYLFVKAMEDSALNFSENAKKFNLLLVPSDDFGCPGYVRISYCVDPAMIQKSLSAFEQLSALYK